MSRQSSRPRRSILAWLWRGVLLAMLVDGLYLARIWPDWKQLAQDPIPRSSFIQTYLEERPAHEDWPPLHWTPISQTQLPRILMRAVVVAEDARFYEHNGFDLQALREAMDYNLERGELRYGASTISQQTVKNLFLSSSRDPLRKWHEALLTWAMERHLSKRRILDLYLNVAEFGLGVYGAEAASQAYFQHSAATLSASEAAQLAASLPNPKHDNPATHTRAFSRRAAKIARRI